jgi:hypothetical protein
MIAAPTAAGMPWLIAPPVAVGRSWVGAPVLACAGPQVFDSSRTSAGSPIGVPIVSGTVGAVKGTRR